MTLVRSTEILGYALEAHFAVGAFNADNMEMVQAIVEAAEEERAPLILQVSEPTVRYAGLLLPSAMVKAIAAEATIPIVLHLDHGMSFEQNVLALRVGFTSLMFDGSRLPYEDNVATTRRIVEMAHVAGVPVEAELGKVLQAGATPAEVEAAMTDPDQAADFARRTGCDSLAVAVGSIHAMTSRDAELDLARIRAIQEEVALPLVLHGSSGVKHESVRGAIELGVCKVNVSTYLKQAFVGTIRSELAAAPEEVDFRVLFTPAREAAKERVREKLRLFGASGRISETGAFRSPPVQRRGATVGAGSSVD
ncbi:MAG: class II fructose-bisphosphate aldolase [Anaerolineae bacterium]